MLLHMQAELVYFGLSVACGILAALLGNGVSCLHRKWKQAVWLGILDLLYWFGVGLFFFAVCFWRNDGVFRAYAVAGILIGCAIVAFLKKRIAKWLGKG